MKDKFKTYLENEFRAVKPTQAAYELRKEKLKMMLNFEQDLKIKGIEDENLVFQMCVEQLGDLKRELAQFDSANETKIEKKRHALYSVLGIAGYVMAFVAGFLGVGFGTGTWHPSWLIIVGGVFAALIAFAGLAILGGVKTQKYAVVRLSAASIIALASVFVFLCFQMFKPMGDQPYYLVFLFMVAGIAIVDAIIALASKAKGRVIWSIGALEVVAVMAYVVCGLTDLIPWHPSWTICLAGPVALIGAGIAYFVKFKNKRKQEGKTAVQKYTFENEDFYTKWDD